MGLPRPVLRLNGPLFRRDDSLCPCPARWTSRRNTGLTLGDENSRFPFSPSTALQDAVNHLPFATIGKHVLPAG